MVELKVLRGRVFVEDERGNVLLKNTKDVKVTVEF